MKNKIEFYSKTNEGDLDILYAINLDTNCAYYFSNQTKKWCDSILFLAKDVKMRKYEFTKVEEFNNGVITLAQAKQQFLVLMKTMDATNSATV